MIDPVDLRYRHDLRGDESSDDETLCGIKASDDTDNKLDIACPCGRLKCGLPVTCPACIAIKAHKQN